MLQAQTILQQIQGSDLAAETRDEVIQHLQFLQTKGEEADQARRRREAQAAQEAQVAEMARNLQEEEQDKLQESDGAKDAGWQEQKKAKKGKGLGKAARLTASTTGMPHLQAHEIGPLATAVLGREAPAPMDVGGRAASEPRSGRGRERHRSPRRPQAGTPARAGAEAAGSLGPAAGAEAAGSPVAGGAAASNQRGGPSDTRSATGLG